MKLKFYFLVLFAAIAVSLRSQAVFPFPQKYRADKGSFRLTSLTQVKGNNAYAALLAGDLSEKLKQLSTGGVSKNSILLDLVESSGAEDDEGYSLEVKTDTVFLRAFSESGLFHAKEVLLQLAREGKGDIRCCRIQDEPRYRWRGFMLDESRHFFGKEKVKQYLDLMASLRLNVFHWHLTDEPGWRIEIKKYPKLTRIGAIGNWHDPNATAQYYTQKDIKEIVEYAAQRHIMIVPEIDMPGHATAACKAYPEYSGGGEGRWKGFTFNPAKEETYRFLSDIFDEVIQLFPSPYIHIGGDEVHYGNQSWFTDATIQQFIKEHELGDVKGLEHYFLRRIASLLSSKGRTMMGWDEIVDAGISPDKAVVMWWRHDKKSQLLKALEQGYRVVLTPRRPLYADFIQFGSHQIGRQWGGYNTLEDIYRFPEPVEFILQPYQGQVMGMQMSLWTERVADEKRLDFMTFPRLVALAESAWTMRQNKEYSLFMQRLPSFLKYLDTLGIYYFDPFNPALRPEPQAPEKEDALQNG